MHTLIDSTQNICSIYAAIKKYVIHINKVKKHTVIAYHGKKKFYGKT